MIKEENNHPNNKGVTELDKQTSFFDLLEGEKAIRYLQSKHSIEDTKCKVLKQRLEQSNINTIYIFK